MKVFRVLSIVAVLATFLFSSDFLVAGKIKLLRETKKDIVRTFRPITKTGVSKRLKEKQKEHGEEIYTEEFARGELKAERTGAREKIKKDIKKSPGDIFGFFRRKKEEAEEKKKELVAKKKMAIEKLAADFFRKIKKKEDAKDFTPTEELFNRAMTPEESYKNKASEAVRKVPRLESELETRRSELSFWKKSKKLVEVDRDISPMEKAKLLKDISKNVKKIEEGISKAEKEREEASADVERYMDLAAEESIREFEKQYQKRVVSDEEGLRHKAAGLEGQPSVKGGLDPVLERFEESDLTKDFPGKREGAGLRSLSEQPFFKSEKRTIKSPTLSKDDPLYEELLRTPPPPLAKIEKKKDDTEEAKILESFGPAPVLEVKEKAAEVEVTEVKKVVEKEESEEKRLARIGEEMAAAPPPPPPPPMEAKKETKPVREKTEAEKKEAEVKKVEEERKAKSQEQLSAAIQARRGLMGEDEEETVRIEKKETEEEVEVVGKVPPPPPPPPPLAPADFTAQRQTLSGPEEAKPGDEPISSSKVLSERMSELPKEAGAARSGVLAGIAKGRASLKKVEKPKERSVGAPSFQDGFQADLYARVKGLTKTKRKATVIDKQRQKKKAEKKEKIVKLKAGIATEIESFKGKKVPQLLKRKAQMLDAFGKKDFDKKATAFVIGLRSKGVDKELENIKNLPDSEDKMTLEGKLLDHKRLIVKIAALSKEDVEKQLKTLPPINERSEEEKARFIQLGFRSKDFSGKGGLTGIVSGTRSVFEKKGTSALGQ